MRRTRTQIIASIGPASGDAETISYLIEHGMDVARINFSHGTHESNGSYITAIREAAEKHGIKVPIIQDLSGPRGQTEDGHAFDEAKAEITEKDLSDLEFGISQNVDYIAQSYVGSPKDVRTLREEIEKRGAKIPIIAKIERQKAIDYLDAIIAEADAIMVARGDLGLAIPIEELPWVQLDIVARCKEAGKPVIVATEMLYSMVEKPTPTRAEVTDVAFAIMCGADVIMLSDETARGKNPKEAVATMEKIAHRAEKSVRGTTFNAL